MVSEKPLAATIWRACPAIALHSTAYTFLAPALAANMDRMPVPQPTSSTICEVRGVGRKEDEEENECVRVERGEYTLHSYSCTLLYILGPHLVLEQVLVLHDGVHVRACPHSVLQ